MKATSAAVSPALPLPVFESTPGIAPGSGGMLLWLDLGGLWAIHACWHQPSIDIMATRDGSAPQITDRLVFDGTSKGHGTNDAIEVLIKGPEVDLGGRADVDKGSYVRTPARRRSPTPCSTVRIRSRAGATCQ